MTTTLTTLFVAIAAVALALLLAFVPLKMLLTYMAKKVRAFIQRQRDRRAIPRGTPDRRRESEEAPAAVEVKHI